MPLVSVIIPAYNSGRYLDEAVQSVIAQTFTDWECIVVDDGSTEDLSRVEAVDSRVRLVRQKNQGVAVARNVGVANSTGEYIAFLDHDDIWLPQKLEIQIKAMESNAKIGACYVHYDEVDSVGARRAIPSAENPVTSYPEFLRYGAPIPSTIMVRRSCFYAVGGFDPTLPLADDQDFMLKLARYFDIQSLSSCQMLYRLHGGNASRNYLDAYQSMMNLARKHALMARQCTDIDAFRATRQMRSCWRRFFGIRAYDAARQSLKEKNFKLFASHIHFAMAKNPGFTLKSILRFIRLRFRVQC